MSKLLYCDLTNGKLRRSLGGAEFSFGTIPHIGILALGLRFSKQIGTRHVEIFPEVEEIRALIGPLDERPETGQFSLKIGGGSAVLGTNLTALLDHDSGAEDLAAALNAQSVVGTAVVVEDDGTFLVTGVADPITVAANTLRPISFVRIQSYEVDGVTTQAIRLQRAPFAFTDTTVERVPRAPYVERIQAGGTVDETDYPEIQKITVPLEFNGSYRIRRSDPVRKSKLLGVGDGPEEIAAAMNPTAESVVLADDLDGVFIVDEHPTDPAMLVTFDGSMKGTGQDLLEIEVFDPPPADHWIFLNPQTAMTEEALRDRNLIRRVPVEIHADLQLPDDDTVRPYCLYRGECSIQESIAHNDLGEVHTINWTSPPDQKFYKPVSEDSLSEGTRFWPFVIGNGADIAFAIPHNLNSPRCRVHLRENATGGRDLVPGTDYRVNHDSNNQLTITLLGAMAATPPALNALTGTVQDLTLTSMWLDPTEIPEANVIGLTPKLDAILEELAELRALAPGQLGAAANGSQKGSALKPLPHFAFIYPVLGRSAIVLPAAGTRLATIDAATLPKVAPRLYPAVHDASVEALPTVVEGGIRIPTEPTLSNVNKVYENQTSDPVDLAIGSGWTLQPGEFAATDGETWYPAERYSNSESSYYPAHLARVLFEDMVQVDELPLGGEMEIRFPLELAVLVGNGPVHAMLVIETANLTADSTPGTPGSNLATQVWAAPHSSQRLVATGTPREYVAGYRVRRANNGDLTADKLVFGKWVSTTAPAAAAFQIRGRLIRIDTANTIAEPAGLIAMVGGTRFSDTASPDTSESLGFLTIRA